MSLCSRFPLVRITIAFAGGIWVAHYCHIDGRVALSSQRMLMLMYCLAVTITPTTALHARGPWLGLLGLSNVFVLGYLYMWASYPQHDTRHLLQSDARIEAYEAVALEDARVKPFYSNVVVAVRRIRIRGTWQCARGRVKISFHPTKRLSIQYGQVLLVRGSPQRIHATSNPYAFDYAAFLRLQHVYHQHALSKPTIAVLAYRPPNYIQAWSLRVLRYCRNTLTRCIPSPDVQAIVLALLLGQKDALDATVRAAYANSGTMHVLAVSGLHVGILYWLINVLLGLLKPIYWLRGLPSALGIAALWFYAFMTGLSPSVLRATIMFTFVALASLLGRRSNIYNTLAASAFLLLCWHPQWLFAVGFQLSYLAVLGIVYLQPRIYGLWPGVHRGLRKLWLLTSISIAAQLATTPLSLYYFHQFPVHFIVANWVVVPAALLTLCLGLTTLATSGCPPVNSVVVWALQAVVGGTHSFVERVQRLPYSVVGNVYLDSIIVFLLYASLLAWLLLMRTRRFKYLLAVSLCFFLLVGTALRDHLAQMRQRRMVFYSIPRHRAVAFIRGRHSVVYTGMNALAPHKYTQHIQPSHSAWGIKDIACFTTKEAAQQPAVALKIYQGVKVMVWEGKTFIFIDNKNHPLPHLSYKLPVDFVVVERDAIAGLQALLSRFSFGTLVIGASNTQSLASRLQAEAEQRGLRSHSLLQHGALVVTW
ncbi:MAG: ComEC/Rec2 family competence protein [Bacteroidota bacterium]